MTTKKQWNEPLRYVCQICGLALPHRLVDAQLYHQDRARANRGMEKRNRAQQWKDVYDGYTNK